MPVLHKLSLVQSLLLVSSEGMILPLRFARQAQDGGPGAKIAKTECCVESHASALAYSSPAGAAPSSVAALFSNVAGISHQCHSIPLAAEHILLGASHPQQSS